MIGAFALLLTLSDRAHAEKRADIFCKSKTAFADAGATVEIIRSGESYHYTYTHNTFAGPKVAAEFAVGVEATNRGKENCELHVTRMADGSHRFFVKQKSENRWDLVLPKEQREGELRCEVKASLRESLCQTGKTNSPESPPLCDDANGDSPGCRKAEDSDSSGAN